MASSKVIIGEPMQGTTANPVLVGTPVEDPEAQRPTVTYTTYAVPPPRGYYPPPPPGYYGTYAGPPPPPPPAYFIVESEPGEECALFGCLFSWIPIVGIVTYIVNFDAPSRSRRGFWARSALFVAIFIILFQIMYWLLWYYE